MIKLKDELNITKVFVAASLIAMSLFLTVTASYGSELMTLNIKSTVGENFYAKILVETKGIKGAGIFIADEKDYKERNLQAPLFLNALYIELTNIYERGLRVAYVQSRVKITEKRFNLLLKLTLGNETYLKAFEVKMFKSVKKEKAVRKNLIFAYTAFYRSSIRDINVGSNNVSFTTTLVTNRLSLDIEKRYGMFFDIGYGILKTSDDILFLGTSVPVTVDNFDSGRTLVYGGGGHIEFFKTDNLVFDITFNITRLKGESKDNTLKILSSTSKVSWNELNTRIFSRYNMHKHFSPVAFVSYSKIIGDFKVDQSLLLVSSSDKKTIDEDIPFGFGLGFVSKPSKSLVVSFLTELVNQVSFKLALSYVF